MATYMRVIMRTIPRKHPEIEILEVNTDKDHIHLLMSIAPKMSVSEAVRILKTNTSRMMVKKFPFIREVYRDAKWPSGQSATSRRLSVSMSVRSRCTLKNQGCEDSGQATLGL